MTDRRIQVRWIGRSVLVTTMCVALLLPFTAKRAHAQITTYHCETSVTFENRARRVFGRTIAAECAGDGHSVPFGNWGVTSNGGIRRNSFQFPGWKKECTLGFLWSNLLQWNSCTRDHTPTAYPHYYTGNGYTQIPRLDGRAVYGSETYQGSAGSTCRSGGAVASFGGNYMKLWEIDKRGGNDLVGDLICPSANIPLTCDTEWDCHGSSGWLSPTRGASAASAEIRISVYTYQVICSNAENDECF